jgi:hypothetical protein
VPGVPIKRPGDTSGVALEPTNIIAFRDDETSSRVSGHVQARIVVCPLSFSSFVDYDKSNFFRTAYNSCKLG